ncbi:MAG: hypothetical protein JSS79_20645 [Bacteroidetes bacterium]|nr:hypothetical protein [Bacteroidota bacterium]
MTKNPILNFRTKSESTPSETNLKKHSINKGFHEENVKTIMSEVPLAATTITKTREAADMSESS